MTLKTQITDSTLLASNHNRKWPYDPSWIGTAGSADSWRPISRRSLNYRREAVTYKPCCLSTGAVFQLEHTSLVFSSSLHDIAPCVGHFLISPGLVRVGQPTMPPGTGKRSGCKRVAEERAIAAAARNVIDQAAERLASRARGRCPVGFRAPR